MGKGNYYGNASESIMYFLTKDYEVDIDIENPINMGNYSLIKYTFNNNNFELKTKHFNINMLAKQIIDTVSNADLEDFTYKINSMNPLRSDTISVLFEKFHGKVSVGNTYYNPSKHRFIQKVTIYNKKDEYIHYGELNQAHTMNVGTYFIEKYLHYTF